MLTALARCHEGSAPPPERRPRTRGCTRIDRREKTVSIFGKISEAIFGRRAEPRGPTLSPGATFAPDATASTAGQGAPPTAWWVQVADQARQAQQQASVPETDVMAQLETRAASHGERLNWRTSIVDLMKLVGIDSSLENRKELARELGYTGDTNDSATMNIWLHKQVMRELAANGGRVPAELTD